MRRSQGDHAVAAEAKPVHPMGQPINASTNSGFSVGAPAEIFAPAGFVARAGRECGLTACSFRGRLLRASVSGLAWPLFQSRAEGVAQRRARSVRSADLRFPALGLFPSQALAVGHNRRNSVRLAPLDLLPEQARGVGHAACEDEEAFAPVRRADARSREESFRNPVTQAFQLASDLAISEVEVIGDVFQENKSGLDFPDDPGDMRPEMAWVAGAEAFAGDAERLARIARKDDVHRATPRAAVEGGKVVIDRSLIQGRVFHPGHEDGRGIGVPLDITHRTVFGFGDGEAEVEPAGAGAERESEQGPSSPVARIRGGM